MNDHPELRKLLTGNKRYVEGRSRHPDRSPYSGKKYAQGQSLPVAVSGKALPGHLPSLTRPIAGAVKQTQKQPGDSIDNASKENVRRVIKKVKAYKPILDKMVDRGRLMVVDAYYDLDTGKVELIE